MRFRSLSPLDDLIGGLAADTRREMLSSHDPLALKTPYERLFQTSANALAQEIARPDSFLPDFICRRTNFGERTKRAPHENFWGVHLSDGKLRTRLPVDDGYNWARALGWAHETIIESVVAEFREEGVL
ncbi:MAG: hypothetical protein KIS66_00490 [Fimbriimonadaceae bacterium]|nr:hypothetical protein [Fimbriimonadaceae bacterium]